MQQNDFLTIEGCLSLSTTSNLFNGYINAINCLFVPGDTILYIIGYKDKVLAYNWTQKTDI